MKIKKAVVISWVTEERAYAVNLEVPTAQPLEFRGVSRDFLDGLVNGVDVEDIVDRLTRKYSAASPMAIRTDYANFLLTLRDAGFLDD
jgi:hypothetical protein